MQQVQSLNIRESFHIGTWFTVESSQPVSLSDFGASSTPAVPENRAHFVSGTEVKQQSLRMTHLKTIPSLRIANYIGRVAVWGGEGVAKGEGVG